MANSRFGIDSTHASVLFMRLALGSVSSRDDDAAAVAVAFRLAPTVALLLGAISAHERGEEKVRMCHGQDAD
jgi:hypothetical protein